MPQPFEQFTMPHLEKWERHQFRAEAKKQNANEKIGDLAHFLVQNFKHECSGEEHVIDTAIRLLTTIKK